MVLITIGIAIFIGCSKNDHNTPIKVETIRITTPKVTIIEDDEQQLEWIISPSNAANKTVTWTSSNKEIATVDANGRVTAKSAGTTTITATTKDGNKKAICEITVIPPYIEFTTTIDVGKELELSLDKVDQGKNIFVDLNMNGVKDVGEELKNSSFQISKQTIRIYGKVTSMSFYGQHLTNLVVSNNKNLVKLDCSYNQLTSLDVSNNTKLTKLNCRFNSLTNLNISNSTELTFLDCCYNKLDSLDVSKHTKLTFLSCWTNQLTHLDVSHNTKLKELYCFQNQLSSLDISNNNDLIMLCCELPCIKASQTLIDKAKNGKLEVTDEWNGEYNAQALNLECP